VEKNEVLLENLKADVWSQDQTYVSKYHNEYMAPNPDI
jgi:hypothetical protein